MRKIIESVLVVFLAGLLLFWLLISFIKPQIWASSSQQNNLYYELEVIMAGKSIRTYETLDFVYYSSDKSIRFLDSNTGERTFLYLHEADLIIKQKIKGGDFDK